jgi:hypothetical protein
VSKTVRAISWRDAGVFVFIGVAAALTALSGCESFAGAGGDDDESLGEGVSRERCGRAELPAGVDLSIGRFRQFNPPQDGALGPLQVDAVTEFCSGIVSIAHDSGQHGGGKGGVPGPGQLIHSADGLHWLREPTNTTAYFRDITSGGDHWVAVGTSIDGGGGVVLRTAGSDPRDFTVVFEHDFPFTGVAHGAGVFVAVTVKGVAVSRDGEHWSWTRVPQDAQYFKVAFGGGRFVVAGVGETLTSRDGSNWSAIECVGDCGVETPDGVDNSLVALQEVHFTAGKFYAFGGSGDLESADGVHFKRVSTRVAHAASGGKVFSTTGFSLGASTSEPPQLFVSTDDGAQWSKLPLTLGGTEPNCVRDPCVVATGSVLVFEPPTR